MKLVVYHGDPETLVRMAQSLANQFGPVLLVLDPEPEPIETAAAIQLTQKSVVEQPDGHDADRQNIPGRTENPE